MKGFSSLFILTHAILFFGFGVPLGAQSVKENTQSEVENPQKQTAKSPPQSSAKGEVEKTEIGQSKEDVDQSIGKQAKPEEKSKDNQSDLQSDSQSELAKESETDADRETDAERETDANSESEPQEESIREQLRERCKDIKPRIESVLKHYFKQKETSTGRSPWGLMHAMVAFGPYAEMYAEGKLVKDVDWLCQNGLGRSWRLLRVENGKLATNQGPGRQGHEGQFLAILAQSQIPSERKLTVGDHEFTIEDLIQYEKLTCRPRTELTFKLIGLSHYIDSDTSWRSSDGRRWDLERIIREELKQPVNGAACGGTHRLMGYSYSLLMRKLQNKPIHGHWKRADEFVRDFRNYSLSLQNRDGSFSTDWFKTREADRDSQRRVQTTGHILEWLIFSATKRELADPRLVDGVEYLANLMWNERTTRLEIGPKGHAIRALRLFYERVLAEPSTNVADAHLNGSDVAPFFRR